MKHAAHCLRLPSLAVAIAVLGAAAAFALEKVSVPSEAEQAEALGLVKELFGKECEAAKTVSERQALAAKLLKKAQTSTDPDNRYALLKVARDIAVKAGDAELAVAAIEETAGEFDVDAYRLKGAAISQAAGAATAGTSAGVAKASLALIDQAVERDDFAAASFLDELALGAARNAKDYELVKRIVARRKEIETTAEAYQEIEKDLAALKQDPTDPAANSAVGKYHFYFKKDLDRALAMLALGSDEELKELAAKDLAGVEDAEEKVALADAWWDLASANEGEAQEAMQVRAEFWYRAAMPELSSTLLQEKVRNRLDNLAARDEPEAGSERLTKRQLLRRKYAPDATEIGDHFYKVFWNSVPWQAAVSACDQMGGHLACAETMEEQRALAELKGEGKVVWVGGYRDRTGVFKWINGVEIPRQRFADTKKGQDFVSFAIDDTLVTRKPDGTRSTGHVKKIQGFMCEWDE